MFSPETKQWLQPFETKYTVHTSKNAIVSIIVSNDQTCGDPGFFGSWRHGGMDESPIFSGIRVLKMLKPLPYQAILLSHFMWHNPIRQFFRQDSHDGAIMALWKLVFTNSWNNPEDWIFRSSHYTKLSARFFTRWNGFGSNSHDLCFSDFWEFKISAHEFSRNPCPAKALLWRGVSM